MKSNDFAQTLNRKFFGIENGRFIKIVTHLRAHSYCEQPLFPDARKSASDVTPAQVAHLVRALSLNYNPFGREINRQIATAHTLRNEKGDYYTDELATLLENGGEQIAETGLQRISYSQDRESIVFVYRDPEDDVVYGDCGALSFERFSILKASALKEISQLLQGVHEHTPQNS